MQFKTKFLFLLNLLLIFTKQEDDTLEFKGDPITKQNENINGNITYKIKVSNQPNYLKITAKGKDSGNQSNTSLVISYYQNGKTINEREQLSLSETETTIMYLNKEQLKSEFFITVQCENYPCSYDFILESKEYAELNLTDTFSYYVTESNKQMKFKISGVPYTPYENEKVENNTITIYAVGNLEISSKLETKAKFKKHKIFNAYLIIIPELNKTYDFNFIVNGAPGDLINIGSNFHDGSNNSQKLLSENGRFIFGYLKQGIKERNCFKAESVETNEIYVSSLDNPPLDGDNHAELVENLFCVSLDFNNNYKDYYKYNSYKSIFDEIPEESFYFIKINKKSNKKIINALQLQISGTFLSFNVETGTNAFFCTITNNSIINYDLYEKNGNWFEASYYECDSFPFCELNDKSMKNAKKLIICIIILIWL